MKTIVLALSAVAWAGLLVHAATPTTVTAGADWIALKTDLEIEPGSALDFSTLGLVDAPAGKHGRVIVNADGHFAFEQSPRTPRRFYGVNLCFGAHDLAKEEADRLAERLVRLGYNALRIHHYERDLTQGQRPTTRLHPQKLEAFDYLVAALIRRGIYLTTDLFVSRGVPWREIGIDRDGQVPMDTFKILVPVHAAAFDNWKQFSRALLDHVNPYTQRRYADEPALAWLAMINEGNFGNFLKDLRAFPEWTQAWNRWLGERYADRAALAAGWGDELAAHEDPAATTVGLPDNIHDGKKRTRDTLAFFADTELEMVTRMKRFLRQELGCRALISNANSWTRFTTDQAARTAYDYVDDHFYVDHPEFLEGSWRLPSRCANASPIAGGATGGRHLGFTRLFDRPFTVTEYNYSGPGRFRGVGGILTGAMGALQDWGGIWRFAYSHGREAMFTPARLNYFDMACDPLSQAAERASICLFLRGDLQPAPHSAAVLMTPADLAHPPPRIPTLAPKWHWLAWVTRIGTRVVPAPATPLPHDLLLPLEWKTPKSDFNTNRAASPDSPAAASTSSPNAPRLLSNPYTLEDAALWNSVRELHLVQPDNLTDPARKIYQSETGEVLIDAPRDRLVLDTPRTAGGYATVGQSLRATQSGVTVRIEGTDATVWVSALDGEPIRRSRRLLVTHLTDLQNTDIQYAEEARKTLLDWGRMPHLVRAGTAEVSLALASPAGYRVWALAPGGRRLAPVPVRVEDGQLHFTVDVAGDVSAGARMLYEVTAAP